MKRYNQLILLLAIFFITCNEKPTKLVNSYLYAKKEKLNNSSWKLVWEDNFETSTLDDTKWTRIPPNNADWGKHMTSDDKCYDLSDGKLFLKGIVNTDTIKDSRPYLTGGIYSKGKFSFKYGKVEIRAKLESAQGAWPAMWMLPENNKYGGWPKSGEIDIMEHLNYDATIYQTTHSHYTVALKQINTPPHGGTAKINPDKFNTYSVEWYPNKLVFSVNGEKTFTYPKIKDVDSSQWPYDEPFYLLIDQQIEGSWVGKADPKTLPVQMIIDWVKVYQ